MDTRTGGFIRKATMWLLLSMTATAAILGTGVAVASMLGDSQPPERWAQLGNVGESFGAISAVLNGMALTALIVTFWLQFQELRIQRQDSREQGAALVHADSELHRTAEASLRLLHLEILKLSIQDRDLAEVWPPFAGNISDRKNKQFLYANAIFQYQWTALRVSDYREEDILEHFRHLFTSPLMREYWQAAKPGRSSLVAGSPEQLLSVHIDRLCEQYDVAAALAQPRPEQDTLRAV